MSQKLYERYQWIVPFDTGTIHGKTAIIRGKALHATMSKNLRNYVVQELQRSARSLARKYIDVNHEYSLWSSAKAKYDAGDSAISPGPKPKFKGHVEDAEFEDGFIEYYGKINHPEYVEKLRDRDAMTEAEYIAKYGTRPITSVSVDATYRFHRDTGNAIEPNGIIFNGLSLVEDPESPGVEGTSIEVLEIRETQRLAPQYRLLQTLLRDKSIITEITSVNNMTSLHEVTPLSPTLTETDEARAQRMYGFTTQEWIDLSPDVRFTYLGRLREQDAMPPCPEGQHRDESGVCVPDDEPDEATEQAEDTPSAPEPCPEGQHRNEAGDCIPDEPDAEEPTMEILTMVDSKITIPTIQPLDITLVNNRQDTQPLAELRLGEPFADYSDFDDCVSKNQDKEDPEAYCAEIKGKTEDVPASEMVNLTEQRHNLEHEELRQRSISARRKADTNRGILSETRKEIHALKKWACTSNTSFNAIAESITTLVQRATVYETNHQQLVEQINTSLQAFTHELQQTVTTIEQRWNDLHSLQETVQTLTTQLDTYPAQFEAFDTKLTALDTGDAERQELRTMFTQFMTEKAGTLTETAAKATTIQQNMDDITVRVENLEERVKAPHLRVTPSPTPPPTILRPVGRLDPATG